jgi:hypothetical protein
MRDQDYPALYRAADSIAAKYQRYFFRAVFWHLALLVSAAIVSVIDAKTSQDALFQAVLLFAALACAVYLFASHPDRHWYAARALAESIKTITWRFVTRAEPFHGAASTAEQAFVDHLHEVKRENEDTAARLTSFIGEAQITSVMRDLRALDVDARREFYVENRIREQEGWYAKKVAFNIKMAKTFFSMLFVVNGVAILFALLRIQFPQAVGWPTDALVPLAASLLTWIQSKKFSELAASYTLTAHEISIIHTQSHAIMSEHALARFVSDAENAFSREHTQWAARRDH